MDKKIAGLLGAAAALGTFASSQAAPLQVPADALRANSYAELLEPIPNAGAILQAMDREQGAASDEAQVMEVQYGRYHHHHHHHWRRPVIVVRPPRYRHHHHHHHHHHHFRRY